MKTVYIDKDCKVFLSDSMDRTAVETDVFDGKCQGHAAPIGLV